MEETSYNETSDKEEGEKQTENETPVEKAKEVKKDERDIVAIFSYLWILFLIPLFGYKNNSFVQFHAKQGLVLFIAHILILLILLIPVIGWIVGPIAGIVWFVLVIIGIINVFKGEKTLLPIIGKFAGNPKD